MGFGHPLKQPNRAIILTTAIQRPGEIIPVWVELLSDFVFLPSLVHLPHCLKCVPQYLMSTSIVRVEGNGTPAFFLRSCPVPLLPFGHSYLKVRIRRSGGKL